MKKEKTTNLNENILSVKDNIIAKKIASSNFIQYLQQNHSSKSVVNLNRKNI